MEALFSDDDPLRRYLFNLMKGVEKKELTLYMGFGIMQTLIPTIQDNGFPINIKLRVYWAYGELHTLMKAALTAWKKGSQSVIFEHEWPIGKETKKQFYGDLDNEGALTICFMEER